MKNHLRFIQIIIFCLLANHTFSQAQPDSANLRRIETLDGNEYIGLLLAEDSTQVELDTKLLGKMIIPRASIKSISLIKISSLKAGKLWFENPQSTRYFWSPNSFGLKKGEGYYQNIWVLWNQASVGVTDYLSIGAGLIPLFFFGGSATPIWVVPKFSIPVVKDKFNMGVGAIVGTLVGERAKGIGIVYGLGTIGDRNNNMTLGIGYGFAEGDWASKPLITLSGMFRTGPRGYFITENYYIGIENESIALLSAGGRTIIRKTGLDYGLFIPIISGMDTFIAIPWLGFTVPFGKK
jgi:hypothetical protein